MARYPNAEWVPWKYQSEYGPTYYKGTNKPEAVVLHVMQGYLRTARTWATQGHYGASWHFSVGVDGTVLQHLEFEDGGYHAGISVNSKQPTWPLWKGHGVNVNNYCVTPNTPVLRANLEWTMAGDLRVGDSLLGFDEYPGGEGRRRRLQHAQVLRAGFRRRPVYRVLMANGDELFSTPEHRWLVRGARSSSTAVQWMTTLDLAATLSHSRRQSPPELPLYFPVHSPHNDYAAGFLAAAFDGEGHLVKHSGGQVFHLGYSQKDNAMAEQVHRFLIEKGFDFRVSEQSGQKQVYTSTLRGGRSDVYRFLMQMRPPRLLARWGVMPKHDFALSARAHVPVDSVEFVGEMEIVELGSSSLTYIANGYGAHNTIGIEHEGFSGEPWPDEQRRASKDLCEWLAGELGVPLDRAHFPAHAEIDIVNRPNDFAPPAQREEFYKFLFEEESLPDPRIDKLIAALGGEAAVDEWNARGNSLLAGYALEQQKLGEHLHNHAAGVTGAIPEHEHIAGKVKR